MRLGGPIRPGPWNLFDRGQQALAILKHDLVELGLILFFGPPG